MTTPTVKPFQSQATGTAGPLPALYARWSEAIFQGPLPKENVATCSNCVMCSPTGETGNADQFFFNKLSKCCTYTPTLANFMAGAILRDPAPSMETGKAILAQRLDNGIGVDPLGIHPPPAYKLLYRHSQKAFGRNHTLRCPHLETATGMCSIWPYRDPTCATWFCKYLRGKKGKTFWEALLKLLNKVTGELSLWCVLQLDIGDEALARIEAARECTTTGENLQPNELDGRFNADTAVKIWGLWWQREAAFYEECARLVSDLDFQDVQRICGPEVRVVSRLVEDAYKKLQETHIPTHLHIGRFEVEEATADAVRVWSYSRFDPLELPVPIYMALSYFDGRPTGEVLSVVEHDLGTRLDHEMLMTLIDFDILQAR